MKIQKYKKKRKKFIFAPFKIPEEVAQLVSALDA
jgi:hypothetical protein